MDEASVRVIPSLALLITVAAGTIVVLAFLQWVDFGIAEIRGTDAAAATGISDGWFVAGLGTAIVLLAGGVLFKQQISFVLLPMIAAAAIVILAIAGFDTVTNWHAAGVHRDNPGIFVQAQGDPTVVPYAISALAILIGLSAAIIRGLQLREEPGLPDQGALDQEVGRSVE